MTRTHQGHQAKKRFGQNFLVDQGIIAAIIAAIAPRPGDKVVEIGPGLAALTGPLVDNLGHLQVVEIDRDIVARLRKRFKPDQLTIFDADALSLDFGRLGDDLRIVGNLPYNISTPLLFHLAGYAEQVRDMHFMLQKEVVERMVATAGSTDYGRLSVMLQYRFFMARLFTVPPESFEPAPKVDSAIVRMAPRPAADLNARDEEMLAHVVSSAFSQRRKMLRNTLKGVATEADLESLAIPPTARAEDVTVEDYVRLANLLSSRQA
ncbi:MAG: 16S rRNA (adenine(1518)-N(6)/adenine(1519)-N(6))-dimethyltransferase RsmA [Rhodocyclaceae bacterium]|nr:16S rRNA (adenine(1518)-N(6)/adenine(1519)-N(6))-dimethyltransferase RsmA [Rhodocyclaceae bacterium]